MHPTLEQAIARANEIIDQATAQNPESSARMTELNKMSKKDLIAIVAKHEKLVSSAPIGEICAQILCEPDCAWLTYDMIQAIIVSKLPDVNTKSKNIAWYAAYYRNEMGRDVQLRKPKNEIAKLIMKVA